VPGCSGDTVAFPHSYVPFWSVTRSVAVSSGAITWSAWAVVQLGPEPVTSLVPIRNETSCPGATVSAASGRLPKKSCVVRVVFVVSA
jgi:hypothetical protein